jgi:hypothetical protein
MNDNIILKKTLAVLIAIVPIYAVYISIVINWELYLASLLIILSLPAIIGQVFLVIGLIKSERWAWVTIIIISALAMFLGCLEILALEIKWSINVLFYSYFEASLIVMPVLGISFIVRKILGKTIS